MPQATGLVHNSNLSAEEQVRRVEFETSVGYRASPSKRGEGERVGQGAPKAGGEIAQQVRGLTALAEDPG